MSLVSGLSLNCDPIDIPASSVSPDITLPSLSDLLATYDDLCTKIEVPELVDPPAIKERRIGKYLYIPVEVSNRELATRAKLAGDMAKQGFQVVLGIAAAFTKYKFGDLAPGIMLFKTMNRLDAKNIFHSATAGHINVCLNEELVSMPYDETLYKQNLFPASRELIDYVLAPDEKAARILKSFIDPKKIRLTGSPRNAAWLGPAKDGDILVCGMAGTINNAVGFENYIPCIFDVMGAPKGDLYQTQRDLIAHERQYLDVMLESVRALREKFGDRVKFRPHPTERLDIYAGKGLNLDPTQSFSERLKTASVVVYVSGCGTGLEAYNAGIPGVRIGTGGSGRSRDLGWHVEHAEECVDAVSELLTNPRTIAENNEEIAPSEAQPLTLVATLNNIHKLWAYPHPFSVVKAWSKRYARFVPEPMHHAKFPDVDDDTIERLADHPALRIDDRIWALLP